MNKRARLSRIENAHHSADSRRYARLSAAEALQEAERLTAIGDGAAIDRLFDALSLDTVRAIAQGGDAETTRALDACTLGELETVVRGGPLPARLTA